MKNLILLTTLLATSALADVSVRVNRIDASVIDNAEESANEVADAKAPAKQIDHNASRSNNTRSSVRPAETRRGSPRDAASGLPTGKRQHRVDADSDGDGLQDRANGCDDDCDSDVSTNTEVRKEVQEAKSAR